MVPAARGRVVEAMTAGTSTGRELVTVAVEVDDEIGRSAKSGGRKGRGSPAAAAVEEDDTGGVISTLAFASGSHDLTCTV